MPSHGSDVIAVSGSIDANWSPRADIDHRQQWVENEHPCCVAR